MTVSINCINVKKHKRDACASAGENELEHYYYREKVIFLLGMFCINKKKGCLSLI